MAGGDFGSQEVIWIDPPEFSDGLTDSYPRTCFDEDLIRAKYLTAEFRDLVWKRTGQSSSLLASSSNEKEDSDFAALSNNGGLKVEFFVPLDESCVRFHKFLLMTGRNLRDGLRQLEQIKLVNHGKSANSRIAITDSASKQTFKVFKYDEDLDELESVDIETISDSEQRQVDLLLGKRQRTNSVPADTVVHSSEPQSAVTNELEFSQSQVFKLSCLPDNYKLYDRLVIEYPSPPLLYNSINKISKMDDDNLPKIRLSRSFALFGHPSGEPMSACQFSRHLMWLYQMSFDYSVSLLKNESLPVDCESQSQSHTLGSACSCSMCPYDTNSLTKFRAGETVWISVEYLYQQSLICHSVAESFFADEIDYWPAEIANRARGGDNCTVYEVELISFPWYALEKTCQPVFVKTDRVLDFMLPFSQYRPPRRLCDSVITSQVKKIFLMTYMRIISESTTFFPCTAENNRVIQLIFGPEVINTGDWLVIRDETAAENLQLDSTKKYLMKVSEMLAKKDVTLNAVTVQVTGDVYQLTVDHAISDLVLAEVTIGIDDIEGRSYVDHPLPVYPVIVDQFNPHLGFSKNISRVFTSHLLDMDLADYFSGYKDYLKSSWPFSSSLAYLLMMTRHRWALLRRCKAETFDFLKDYKDKVVDNIPVLLSVKEEQERLKNGRDTRQRATSLQPFDTTARGNDLISAAEPDNLSQRTRRRSDISSAQLALVKEARELVKREQMQTAPKPLKSLHQLQKQHKILHQSVNLDAIYEEQEEEEDHIVVVEDYTTSMTLTTLEVDRNTLLPTPPPSEASPTKLLHSNVEEENRRMTRAVRRTLDEEEEYEKQQLQQIAITPTRRSKRSRL